MFTPRQDIRSIQAKPQSIVAVIESINSPMVAAVNKPLEPAKSFIVGIRNPSGLYSIYIYLYLMQSKECVIYLHEPSEIPMEAYHETEVQALHFVESMGFMVDNLNYRNLTQEQQNQLLESLPLFHEDLESFARRSESPDDAPPSADELDAELTPLSDDVIELADLVEASESAKAPVAVVVSQEGLAKIIRLLGSF